MFEDQIRQVRSFNRAVTRRIGVLEDSYLSRGRPLSEARVLFETGVSGGSDIREMRQRLGLDSGYMSRLLRSLERQGLIELRPSGSDGRLRRIELTDEGRNEYAAYDRLSDDLAERMLRGLSGPERDRLAVAMSEVERLIQRAGVQVDIEPADSAEARRCLESYYDELARRFDNGFDPAAGNTFDPAEMAPPMGWFVLARLDGEPVGCGALKRLDDGLGEIKRVWTADEARGKGVASRIMDRLEALAVNAGFPALRLDTNGALKEAQAMYASRGYRPIARYNDNPYAEHWFEKELAGKDADLGTR